MLGLITPVSLTDSTAILYYSKSVQFHHGLHMACSVRLEQINSEGIANAWTAFRQVWSRKHKKWKEDEDNGTKGSE